MIDECLPDCLGCVVFLVACVASECNFLCLVWVFEVVVCEIDCFLDGVESDCFLVEFVDLSEAVFVVTEL